MATAVLQMFVRESLIDLDGDDSRLVKLQSAAAGLANVCAARPVAVTLPLLLAALRPDEALVDRDFEAVASTIEEHWATYSSAFKDGRATTLYRAVALQAIAEAIEIEPGVGTAVALLLRNLRSELALGKHEPAIGLVVDVAEAAFASERDSGMGPLPKADNALAPSAKAVKIDRATLKKRIESAVGPHDRQGQALESPNQHWPNSGNPWSFDFSDRMVAVIGDWVDLAIAESAKLDAKNHGAVGASLTALGRVDPTLKRSVGLLWWRQALYSETAGKPYRALSMADAVVHAVIDLAVQVPPAYEPALDSFLMEAILALNLPAESVGLAAIQIGSTASTALACALQCEAPAGFMIAKLTRGEASVELVDPILGPDRWAVWLIRELMAVRAVEGIETATQAADGTQ